MKLIMPGLVALLALAGCNRESTPRAGEDVSLSTNSAVIPPEADGIATTPVTMPPPAEAVARCVALPETDRAACEAAAARESLTGELEHNDPARSDAEVQGQAAESRPARPAARGTYDRSPAQDENALEDAPTAAEDSDDGTGDEGSSR